MFFDTVVFVSTYILLYGCAKGFNTYTLCALLSSILSCQVIFCPICGRFLDIDLTFDCLTFNARECII